MPRALTDQGHAYVYAIGFYGTLLKIGFSLSPERRRAQLSARYKTQLTLLGDCRVNRCDAAGIERLVHARLHEKRREGEWFAVSYPEALGAIFQAALDYEQGLRVIRPVAKPAISFSATEALLQEIDEWRANQRPIPNKSEAARMLIEKALLAEAERSKAR